MSKLTHEQMRLLYWLSLPETVFEVCRRNGFMDDEYNGLHNYRDSDGKRFKFDIRTLYCLEGEALLTGHYVYHFGISWERYTLTESGQALSLLLNEDDLFNVE